MLVVRPQKSSFLGCSALSCVCLCWTNTSLSAEESQMEEGGVILLWLCPASLLPCLTRCLFFAMGMCLQILCTRLTSCYLCMPCISNAIRPLRRQRMRCCLWVTGRDRHSLRHQAFCSIRMGLFSGVLHHQFTPVQIILLKNTVSQNTVSKYTFFFFFPQRTAKESLYLFRKSFWLKHLEVRTTLSSRSRERS